MAGCATQRIKDRRKTHLNKEPVIDSGESAPAVKLLRSRMRSTPRLLLISALVVTLLPGCSALNIFKRKNRPVKQEETKPVQIGTITLVNPDDSFVLIDTGYRMSPAMSDTLESRAPDGSTAQLRVTGIRKRPFVIADIVGGAPGKGDAVFQQKQTAKPASTPSPQAQ
jgi:hypothetical protein